MAREILRHADITTFALYAHVDGIEDKRALRGRV